MKYSEGVDKMMKILRDVYPEIYNRQTNAGNRSDAKYVLDRVEKEIGMVPFHMGYDGTDLDSNMNKINEYKPHYEWEHEDENCKCPVCYEEEPSDI